MPARRSRLVSDQFATALRAHAEVFSVRVNTYWTFMTDTIGGGQDRNHKKDAIQPIAVLEITRMRADIVISRAGWEARSMALRESQSCRGGQSTPTTISPKAQGNAERLETPLSVRVFAAAPGYGFR